MGSSWLLFYLFLELACLIPASFTVMSRKDLSSDNSRETDSQSHCGEVFPMWSLIFRIHNELQLLQFVTHCAPIIRGVVADSDDSIRASATDLGRQGFINYFGLQVRSWVISFFSIYFYVFEMVQFLGCLSNLIFSILLFTLTPW